MTRQLIEHVLHSTCWNLSGKSVFSLCTLLLDKKLILNSDVCAFLCTFSKWILVFLSTFFFFFADVKMCITIVGWKQLTKDTKSKSVCLVFQGRKKKCLPWLNLTPYNGAYSYTKPKQEVNWTWCLQQLDKHEGLMRCKTAEVWH